MNAKERNLAKRIFEITQGADLGRPEAMADILDLCADAVQASPSMARTLMRGFAAGIRAAKLEASTGPDSKL